MLRDVTRNFKAACSKNPAVVLDNYTMKEGLYIRFKISEPLEYDYIVIRKNEERIKDDKFKWFRAVDYYSSILDDDMNKAVDTKKQIHSTNEFSVFIKKDNFPGMHKESMNNEVYKERIEGYFNSLKSIEDKFWDMYNKSEIKKQVKLKKEEFFNKYFKNETNYLKSEERINRINIIRDFFINHLVDFQNIIGQIDSEEKFTNYIKIFIDEDISKYITAYRLYIIPRIYNKNDYNVLIDGNIMGLPANNMSLNDKKPYMLLRTMKTSVPARVSFDDAVAYKDFFLWLKSQSYSNMTVNYEYEFDRDPGKSEDGSRFDIYINKKEGIVEDFDNIPFRPGKIEFKYNNYLNITENDNITVKANEVWGRGKLLDNISFYFFAGKMKGYFRKAEPKVETNVFTSKMQSLFFISRNAIYDYIVYDVNESFKAMVDRVTLESIKEQLLYTTKGIPKKMGEAYNLRLSLINYFSGGENDMGDTIKKLNESLKEKLEKKDLALCSSDEEFYFTAGQLTYYILHQSEAKEKTYGMVEPFIHAKTPQDLKNKLKDIFSLYKHAINLDYIKFKNAFSMVMGYDCNSKFTGRMQDMYYAGLMSNNILFSKSEKDNGEVNKDEK